MKELECEIWCPSCKVYRGKVYRIQKETGWVNKSEPKNIGKYCTVCEGVLERKAVQ